MSDVCRIAIVWSFVLAVLGCDQLERRPTRLTSETVKYASFTDAGVSSVEGRWVSLCGSETSGFGRYLLDIDKAKFVLTHLNFATQALCEETATISTTDQQSFSYRILTKLTQGAEVTFNLLATNTSGTTTGVSFVIEEDELHFQQLTTGIDFIKVNAPNLIGNWLQTSTCLENSGVFNRIVLDVDKDFFSVTTKSFANLVDCNESKNLTATAKVVYGYEFTDLIKESKYSTTFRVLLTNIRNDAETTEELVVRPLNIISFRGVDLEKQTAPAETK